MTVSPSPQPQDSDEITQDEAEATEPTAVAEEPIEEAGADSLVDADTGVADEEAASQKVTASAVTLR